MTEPIIEARGVYKHFAEGEIRASVLNGVNLSIQPGESVAVLGASGSGKSTLLHLLGGLDTASDGSVWVDGHDLGKADEREMNRIRNRTLGFVYQFHHLLPEFSALENVAMPLLIGGSEVSAASERATHCLQQVGLEHRIKHRPAEMSGGERQRAAIARALAMKPRCVLADEPTGNLDSANAARALDAMLDLRADVGAALVIVTHDAAIAERLDRTVELVDGRIAD